MIWSRVQYAHLVAIMGGRQNFLFTKPACHGNSTTESNTSSYTTPLKFYLRNSYFRGKKDCIFRISFKKERRFWDFQLKLRSNWAIRKNIFIHVKFGITNAFFSFATMFSSEIPYSWVCLYKKPDIWKPMPKLMSRPSCLFFRARPYPIACHTMPSVGGFPVKISPGKKMSHSLGATNREIARLTSIARPQSTGDPMDNVCSIIKSW